jgi:hypothetical protein
MRHWLQRRVLRRVRPVAKRDENIRWLANDAAGRTVITSAPNAAT